MQRAATHTRRRGLTTDHAYAQSDAVLILRAGRYTRARRRETVGDRITVCVTLHLTENDERKATQGIRASHHASPNPVGITSSPVA